jgi:hypothetical protein
MRKILAAAFILLSLGSANAMTMKCYPTNKTDIVSFVVKTNPLGIVALHNSGKTSDRLKDLNLKNAHRMSDYPFMWQAEEKGNNKRIFRAEASIIEEDEAQIPFEYHEEWVSIRQTGHDQILDATCSAEKHPGKSEE